MINTVSLKKNRDFRTVYSLGRSRANHFFVVYIYENNLGYNRLGVSVSRKVGNSVIRHRLKRQVKECYRISENRFAIGYDIVVIARVGASSVLYSKVESSIFSICDKLGIIR